MGEHEATPESQATVRLTCGHDQLALYQVRNRTGGRRRRDGKGRFSNTPMPNTSCSAAVTPGMSLL